MGFVKQIAAKATGADVQADIAARQADAQAVAIREASQKSAAAAQAAAAQLARQQESGAARAAAEGAAADALSAPVENPDVQLGGVKDQQTASAANKKRRQTFGIGSAGSGVNI